MDPEEIEKLHEAAVGLYVSARYSEARRAWEAVLTSFPEDERALEGIRMIRVLAGEWPADAPGSASHPAGSLEDELRRIEALLGEARYGDALLAAQRATETERGSAEARHLAGRALELFEAAPYIDVELTKAKQAASEGRPSEARAACQRILSLDPAHRAAAEILSRVGRGEAPRSSVASAPAPPAPAPPSVAAPTKPPAPPAPSRMQAPAADAFFDITDADIAAEAPPANVRPLGASASSTPASAAAAEAIQHEDAVFESGKDRGGSAKEKDAVSGFKEAEGSGHHSLFEMPDEDVPTINANFSELEAEIDETQGVPSEGEVDFEIPDGEGAAAFSDPGPAARASAPAVKPAQPASDAVADFSFDEEDFALDAGAAPVGPSVGSQTPEMRIVALLDESRRALKIGRYSDAIEAAARAFAIDPDAQGAQQLIDEARTLQDAADRQTEDTLDAAREKLATGDLSGAEEGFRAVLKTHPSHREALDGLDQIARRRNETEIKGAGAGREAKSAPAEKKPEAAASAASAEEPWPLSEPLTPKPVGPKPGAAEPAVQRIAPTVTTPAGARKSSGLGRKLVVIGGLVGVLVLLVAGGLFAFSLFLGRSRPVEKALVAPRKERKEIIKIDRAAPKSAPAEKPAPDPSVLASGVPRTIPDARRLASQGKLEAARVVLADMVRAAPDNVEAVDALKGVQQQIVDRDRVVESMEQIKHAYKQERYEDALRMLYRLPAGMQRGEIEDFKSNAWYNNGINYLLGGNTVEAVHCFDEALNINPRDQQAHRLRSYAKTYSEREKDSAFRAFVDQLDKRPIDAK